MTAIFFLVSDPEIVSFFWCCGHLDGKNSKILARKLCDVCYIHRHQKIGKKRKLKIQVLYMQEGNKGREKKRDCIKKCIIDWMLERFHQHFE